MTMATTWTLVYARTDEEDGEDTSFDITILGPPPIEDAATWRTVPADVRDWAQMNGQASRAQAVSYYVAELVDVTGFTDTGAVRKQPVTRYYHDEVIR
jgi:hypothetical protein